MPLCDCGALTARYIVHTESPDGKPLDKSYSSCPACRPEEFPADLPFALSLDRIVTGPEAYPHKYRRDSEGVYHPTDEMMQDDLNWANAEGPTGRAERIKRETRRTTPMSSEEVQRLVRWGKDHPVAH